MSRNRHKRKWRNKKRQYKRRSRLWPTIKLLAAPMLTFVAVIGLMAYQNDWKISGPAPRVSQLHRVIDGDTIEATVPGHGRTRIRLSSIDAPERDQPFGSQSTTCLRDILTRGSLSVKPKKTDRYGRLVADLYVAGNRVDVQMVERGCAWWYSRYAPASVTLLKAHYSAKAEKRGLWAGDNPVEPESWRHR